MSDREREKSEEFFKKVIKAYEVLKNPIARQAYDIENELNSGGNLEASTYEDTTSNANYF